MSQSKDISRHWGDTTHDKRPEIGSSVNSTVTQLLLKRAEAF